VTGKITKAQVVEALRSLPLMQGLQQGRSGLVDKINLSVDDIAEALVRAGLAEEPREEGWYWVIIGAGSDNWQIMQWGSDVWTDFKGGTYSHPMRSVHPARILPPAE
jgi:hypothetical protein